VELDSIALFLCTINDGEKAVAIASDATIYSIDVSDNIANVIVIGWVDRPEEVDRESNGVMTHR